MRGAWVVQCHVSGTYLSDVFPWLSFPSCFTHRRRTTWRGYGSGENGALRGAAVPVFREVISLCSESLFLTGQRDVLQVVFAVYNCLLIRTRNTNYSNLPGKTRCPFVVQSLDAPRGGEASSGRKASGPRVRAPGSRRPRRRCRARAGDARAPTVRYQTQAPTHPRPTRG